MSKKAARVLVPWALFTAAFQLGFEHEMLVAQLVLST